MTKQELKAAEKLLEGRADRTESIHTGKGLYALTAHWRDGGQKLFRSLEHVQEHVAERERAEQH